MSNADSSLPVFDKSKKSHIPTNYTRESSRAIKSKWEHFSGNCNETRLTIVYSDSVISYEVDECRVEEAQELFNL